MKTAGRGDPKARGRKVEMSVGRAGVSKQIEQLSRADDQSFAAGYKELVSCLELQLREEQAALEAVNSRALHSHLEQHARVLAALHQAEPEIEQGNLTLGREALALLDRWLPLERTSIDMALLTALTPMGRRRPLEARQPGQGRRRMRPPSPPDNTLSPGL